MEQEIRESLKDLSKEQAIERLETWIFYEEMADLNYNFELVDVYKKILNELKEG